MPSSKSKIEAEMTRINLALDNQGGSQDLEIVDQPAKPDKDDDPAKKEPPEGKKNGNQDRFGYYSVLPSTKAGLMGLSKKYQSLNSELSL